MITEQHIEEGLSRACIQAVSAKAGYTISTPDFDYGVDGTFNEVSYINNRRCQSGRSIHFQLKASKLWKEDNNSN
jgi:hypothetical protein